MKLYCAKCGANESGTPCSECGALSKTTIPPTKAPCAYCGATPSWPVDYHYESEMETIFLCSTCDQSETDALNGDDDDSDSDISA